MRRIQDAIVWTLTVFALAVPASAQRAAAGHEHGGEGGGGAGGGGGGAGGGGGGAGGGGATSGSLQENQDSREVVNHLDEESGEETRPYSIALGLETHALLWRSNLEGAAENKLFNYYFVDGHVDITSHNRLSIYSGVYERFLADSGETGVRMDNTVLGYTRLIPLSRNVLMQARASLALPTAYDSYLASLYVEPSVSLQLSGHFFNHLLSIDARLFGSYYVVKYAEYAGGNPNPQSRLGMVFTAELTMPFAHALSLGAELFVAYYWYYNVHNGGGPNMMEPMATQDPTYATQPIQEVYGGEVFARFTFPAIAGIHTDLRVAVAQGDTTLGYTSVIHDGNGYTYLSYYLNSEIYGALTLRY